MVRSVEHECSLAFVRRRGGAARWQASFVFIPPSGLGRPAPPPSLRVVRDRAPRGRARALLNPHPPLPFPLSLVSTPLGRALVDGVSAAACDVAALKALGARLVPRRAACLLLSPRRRPSDGRVAQPAGRHSPGFRLWRASGRPWTMPDPVGDRLAVSARPACLWEAGGGRDGARSARELSLDPAATLAGALEKTRRAFAADVPTSPPHLAAASSARFIRHGFARYLLARPVRLRPFPSLPLAPAPSRARAHRAACLRDGRSGPRNGQPPWPARARGEAARSPQTAAAATQSSDMQAGRVRRPEPAASPCLVQPARPLLPPSGPSALPCLRDLPLTPPFPPLRPSVASPRAATPSWSALFSPSGRTPASEILSAERPGLALPPLQDAKLAGIENQSKAMQAELTRMIDNVSDEKEKAVRV
jgi:hypothetical protein